MYFQTEAMCVIPTPVQFEKYLSFWYCFQVLVALLKHSNFILQLCLKAALYNIFPPKVHMEQNQIIQILTAYPFQQPMGFHCHLS